MTKILVRWEHTEQFETLIEVELEKGQDVDEFMEDFDVDDLSDLEDERTYIFTPGRQVIEWNEAEQ